MSFLTKHAAATLAVAACIIVASGVRAAESNDDQTGSIASTDSPVSMSAACHPMRGACPKHPQRIAGRANEDSTTPAYEQVGSLDRYSVSSSCHPAYAPSWIACARARLIRTADPAN